MKKAAAVFENLFPHTAAATIFLFDICFSFVAFFCHHNGSDRTILGTDSTTCAAIWFCQFCRSMNIAAKFRHPNPQTLHRTGFDTDRTSGTFFLVDDRPFFLFQFIFILLCHSISLLPPVTKIQPYLRF